MGLFGVFARVSLGGLREDLLGDLFSGPVRSLEALATILVPSIATSPGRSSPCLAHTASTWPNKDAIAVSWVARNRAIVAWSGCWLAATTRNATSSTSRRSILRLDRSPVQ
jgi:hypothetical protein